MIGHLSARITFMAAGHLIARSNQAGYMTATVLPQLGQEGLARERGPYMTSSSE